jgi:hypothetical protein
MLKSVGKESFFLKKKRFNFYENVLQYTYDFEQPFLKKKIDMSRFVF